MKKLERTFILSIIALLSGITHGADSEALYTGNVGQINPTNPQVLTGNIQVSGITNSTKLTLDLVLPNGTQQTISNITISENGTYNIFELINSTNLPQGAAQLNVTSENAIPKENLKVDVSLMDYDEANTGNVSPSPNGNASASASNRVAGTSSTETDEEDPGTSQNQTIGGSLATVGDSAFLTNTQESFGVKVSNKLTQNGVSASNLNSYFVNPYLNLGIGVEKVATNIGQYSNVYGSILSNGMGSGGSSLLSVGYSWFLWSK